MKISTKGLELIKQFETCRLHAYQDDVGIWTIGWGHTGDVAKPGAEIDQARADALLVEDCEKCERTIQKLVHVKLNENQFSALAAFIFNIGGGHFATSTLLLLLNSGEYEKAADQLLRWNKARGRELAGLTRRREAERALFLS